MGMTVKKLNDFLRKCPQDMEVYVEMNINGVEFDCPISDIYESGKLYIFGKDKFDVKIIRVEDSNVD